MRTSRHTALLAAWIMTLVACSQSTSPGDNIVPNVSTCATDLSCPYGQECKGAGCAVIPTGLYAHIQTASALFRTYLDDNELAWRASHYDLVIGQIRADELRAHNPNLRMFEYLNIRYLLNTTAAAQYALAHGQNIEDYYLHYRIDTAVPTWEGTVLVPGFPAGWVPGWSPGGGYSPANAVSRLQSRVPGFSYGLTTPWYLANIGHAGYRAFITEHVRKLLDGTFWFSGFSTGPIDGVVCDNAIFYPQFNEGALSRTAEYWGIAPTDAHPYAQSYENEYPELAEQMLDHFGSTRDVMPNYGHVLFLNYPNESAATVQTTTPWIWGEVWVTFTDTWTPTSGANRCISYEDDYQNGIRKIVEQTKARGRRVLGARDVANGNAGTDRGKLFTLGLYYLVHNPHTYYMYETMGGHTGGGAHMSTWAWNPAVTVDVGQPDVVPPGLLDFSGAANTKEHYVFASGSDPYNASLTYHVLARRFTNALVLVKMLPEGSVTDDRSITTHVLDGNYALLQADGNPGATVSQVQLRNNEAVILLSLGPSPLPFHVGTAPHTP